MTGWNALEISMPMYSEVISTYRGVTCVDGLYSVEPP